MSSNLEKLQQMIALANDGLSREEFVQNFAVIIDLIKKLQASTKETMDALDTKYADKVTELTNRLTSVGEQELAHTKQMAVEYCASELQKMLLKIDQRLSEIKDGEDADETIIADKVSTQVLEDLKPLIPTIEAIEQDLPKLGTQIRDGLELLQGEERLDISAIKGLAEKLNRIDQSFRGEVGGGGGSGLLMSLGLLTTPALDQVPIGDGTGKYTFIDKASLGSGLPTQTGNSGKYLTTDGSSASWATVTGGSGITRSVNSISSPTTAGATASTDYVYLITGTTTLTLPTAIGNTNQYEVIRKGTNTVTIATTAGQTINGSGSALLTIQNQSLTLQSDGSNWQIK